MLSTNHNTIKNSNGARIITILVLFALVLPVLALAQDDVNTNVNATTTEETEDEVTAEDLEVSEPKILPNSPWYWAKSLWRSMKLWATFDPVKKAEKRLEIANERLIEIQALADAGEISENRLEKILGKYEKEIEKLASQVEKFGEDSQEEVSEFLDKFTKQEFKRQRLLDKLELKLETAVKAKAVERIRQKTLEKFGEILEDVDIEDIEENISEVLEDVFPLELKNMHNLQILERLKEKVSEQAQGAIIRAQANALNRLGSSFREMSLEEKIEKVAEFLEELDNATTTEDILEQTGEDGIPGIIQQARQKVKEKVKEKQQRRGQDDDDEEDDSDEIE